MGACGCGTGGYIGNSIVALAILIIIIAILGTGFGMGFGAY
ncbi:MULTISPECIES: hypothetical protein [Heliobacterium]|nr:MULTISPECIES: hypothetical protein [Heliobacterium]